MFLIAVKKEGDQMYSLLQKLGTSSRSFSVLFKDFESEYFAPDKVDPVGGIDGSAGFDAGLDGYTRKFTESFMQSVDAQMVDQRRIAKLLSDLKNAQNEADHYVRKVKQLKEKEGKGDKVRGLRRAVCRNTRCDATRSHVGGRPRSHFASVRRAC